MACSAIRKPSQRQFLPAKFRFWIWLSQGAGAWDKRDCAGMLSMRQAKPSQVFAMRESATITSRGPRRGLGPTILAFVDSRTMRRLARDPGWLRRSHLDGESDESLFPLNVWPAISFEYPFRFPMVSLLGKIPKGHRPEIPGDPKLLCRPHVTLIVS